MHIDWWTLALQTINVLVLIWLLGRVLFRPIADIVAARRAEAVKLLDEAKTARTAAEVERAEAAAEVARQSASRAAALASATEEGQAAKAALVASAAGDIDRLRAQVEAEIARERAGAARLAADRAGRLAVDIAAKLLARLPEDALITGFVPGLVAGIAALPEATRRGLDGDGPLRLTAARPPTPEEDAALRSALAQALGGEVALAVVVDPAVVAGLELETPHAVVRNSFRADLERIAAELTRHDES